MSNTSKSNDSGIKIICQNKKARFNYFLHEFYEAGIELKGTEIKSIRNQTPSIDESNVVFKDGEAYILFMNIPIYKQGNIFNHDVTRMRKLLLHKTEIRYLSNFIKTHPHYFVIPTKVYFKKGMVKVEVSLAESKRVSDKRETIKKREAERDINRSYKNK